MVYTISTLSTVADIFGYKMRKMIQLNPSLFAAYKDRPMSDNLVDWFLVFVI